MSARSNPPGPLARAARAPRVPVLRRAGALAGLVVVLSGTAFPATGPTAAAQEPDALATEELLRQQVERALALDPSTAGPVELLPALVAIDERVKTLDARVDEARRATGDRADHTGAIRARRAEIDAEIASARNELRQKAVRRYLDPEDERALVFGDSQNLSEGQQRKVLAESVGLGSAAAVNRLRAARAVLEDLDRQAAAADSGGAATGDGAAARAEALTGELNRIRPVQARLRATWDKLAAAVHTDPTFTLIPAAAAPSGPPPAAPRAAPGPSPGGGRMTWPLGGRISEEFGGRRRHVGMDIANVLGSPIWAALPGKVTRVDSHYANYGPKSANGRYGNLVVIDHGGGISTRYAHQMNVVARVGQQVSAGQLIGHVGMTGDTSGPHLHFEVWLNGRTVNPRNYLGRGTPG